MRFRAPIEVAHLAGGTRRPLKVNHSGGTLPMEVAGGAAPESVAEVSASQVVQAGNRLPIYPPRAREEGWQGRARLLLELTAEGGVKQVELLESSGFDVLDAAAMEAAREWRFENWKVSQVIVPVDYRLVD